MALEAALQPGWVGVIHEGVGDDPLGGGHVTGVQIIFDQLSRQLPVVSGYSRHFSASTQ
jgi:hypothetical protein